MRKLVFTVSVILISTPLISSRDHVSSCPEIYYNITEASVENSGNDGSSPNYHKWYVSDVYESECYMNDAASESFKDHLTANEFEPVSFEYLGTLITWSETSYQRAVDRRNEMIAEKKQNKYKVIPVKEWSHTCKR